MFFRTRKRLFYAIIHNRQPSFVGATPCGCPIREGRTHGFAPTNRFQGVLLVNMVNIVPLNAAGLIDEAAIGPKAMGLVRMSRIGLAVPPDDPKAISEAMESMADDPSRRKEMARRARDLALEEMDWRERARELAEVILAARLEARG